MAVNKEYINSVVNAVLISALLIFLGNIIPVFGILLFFLSIVPQLLLILKNEYSKAVVSWIILAVLVSLMRNPWFFAVYGIIFIPFTVISRYIFMSQKTIESKITLSAVFWLGFVIVITAAGQLIWNFNIMEEIVFTMKALGGISIGKYYDMRLPQAQINQIENAVLVGILFIKQGIFGICAAFSIAGCYLIYLFSSKYCDWLDNAPTLKRFRMPEHFIWILIAAGLLFLLGKKTTVTDIATIIGVNVGLFIFIGYFITGISLITVLLTKWKVSPLFQLLILGFFVIFFRGYYALTFIGVADIWVNFRKRWEQSNEKGE